MNARIKKSIYDCCLSSVSGLPINDKSEDPISHFSLTLSLLSKVENGTPISRNLITACLNIAAKYLSLDTMSIEDTDITKISKHEERLISNPNFTAEYQDYVFFLRKFYRLSNSSQEKLSVDRINLAEFLASYCRIYLDDIDDEILASTCLDIVKYHYGCVKIITASDKCKPIYDVLTKPMLLTFNVAEPLKMIWEVFVSNLKLPSMTFYKETPVLKENSPPMSAILSSNLEEFEKETFIGYGISCNVYKVKKEKEHYACKLFRPRDGQKISQAFLVELCLLKMLNHPNIIRLVAIIPEDAAMIYEIMDSDAKSWRDNKYMCSVEEIDSIVKDLLHGCQVIHNHDIIHTDIKPDNILVKQTTKGLVFKYCDFGNSIRTNLERFFIGNEVTSLQYRAPELLSNNGDVTNKIDIWSLSCTIWEIIYGRILFPGDNPEEQSNIIRVKSKELNLDLLPPKYTSIFINSLVENPNQRYDINSLVRLLE